MRRYETIFIADPDLQEEARKGLFEKFTNLIAKEGGILINFDDWGNKKLAYEIKKKPRGHYVCLTYGGTGELVKELERNFRLDDKVLKFMTILLEKDINPETLKQELADLKEQEEAAKEEVKAETTAKTEAADTSEESDTPVETEEEE